MASRDAPERHSKRARTSGTAPEATPSSKFRWLDDAERPTAAEKAEATSLLLRMIAELPSLRKLKSNSLLNYYACALAIRRGEFPIGDTGSRKKFGLDGNVVYIRKWLDHLDEWHAIHPDELPSSEQTSRRVVRDETWKGASPQK